MGQAMRKEDVTEELAAEVKRYREGDGLDVRSISEVMDISMQDVTQIINSDVYKEEVAEPGDCSQTDVRHSAGGKDLVPFEEVVNAERMEFELENRGKYRVYEVYCEDPKCSCGGAKLIFFKCGEKTPVFDGYFNIENFEFDPESLRSIGEEVRTVVEGFFENLTDSRRRLMLARFKLAKGVGEDPAEYIDFSSFEFDYCLLYKEVFRVEKPEVFRVEHKGRDYVIYDQYCCNPSCHCNSAILSVFELKHSEDPLEGIFSIRVGLDGGYEIEDRECEKSIVADFYEHEIGGNEELLTVLRYRYGKMKALGEEALKQRREIVGNQKNLDIPKWD